MFSHSVIVPVPGLNTLTQLPQRFHYINTKIHHYITGRSVLQGGVCVHNERKCWTYSEKSPNLILLHVCEIPVAACEIVASKWFATGIV